MVMGPVQGPNVTSQGGGFASMLGGLMGGISPLGLAGSLLGGMFGNSALDETKADINNMAQLNPQGFQGPGGFGITEGGTGTQSNAQQLAMNQLLSQSMGLAGGGLFNDPNLQAALGGNDMLGALNQSNQALGQQAGGFYNQGGFNQNMANIQGLGNQFAGSVAGGPQDLSGGLMGQNFARGMGNQAAAGDQSALFNQSLSNQRAAFAPQANRQFNQMQDRLFATGQLGSTGGGEQMRGLFEAQNQQDLNFQNNAFGQAMAQQNFLGNLGAQQMGQGAGFMGQNLGQFNQNVGAAQQFGALGAGMEGQGFNQMLRALGQNQSAGNQRLQNAMGLFGLGTDTFGSQFGLGLQGQGMMNQRDQLFSDLFLGQQNAAANAVGATGQHAQALGQVGASQGGFLSGLVGGLFG